jgi:hypothetical protein
MNGVKTSKAMIDRLTHRCVILEAGNQMIKRKQL